MCLNKFKGPKESYIFYQDNVILLIYELHLG